MATIVNVLKRNSKKNVLALCYNVPQKPPPPLLTVEEMKINH